MRFNMILAAAFWCLLAAVACNREEITFSAPSGLLRFSRDTVFCDTVYNQVRSETYDVKVYNTENKDVTIPHIALEGGSASPYRINVDGKSGTDFTNIPLRKKDSLFIFVEIAPTATAPSAIAEDRIIFTSPAGQQHVTLFSVVQDAEFFIQSKSNPNILTQNTVWNNNKAKIIFGDLTLAEGKTLTIQAGTKVYFHKNSGLNISKNSGLNVNGSLGNEVTFRGDRNDTRYDTLPNNWNAINLAAGANLTMNYGKIFGGVRGLNIINGTASINNSILHTFQEYGIYAVNSTITAQNLVMNNCGTADFGIYKGGTYNITHATLANYWNLNSSLPGSVLVASNAWTNASGGVENAALTLNVKNSILYSDKQDAVAFKPTTGQTFNYNFLSSLIKYGSASTYTLDASNIKNLDPKFQNYFTQKLNLRVKSDSPAKGKGDLATARTVPQDIDNVDRTANATIGAYQ